MMTTKGVVNHVTAGLVVAAVAGCAAAAAPKDKVQYKDPKQAEQLTAGFGRTDLQAIADEMVQSMLQSPAIHDQPVVVMSAIKNKTSEDIDTKAITDKIRVALVNSGKVQFLAADTRDDQMEEREYQKDSGNVDQSSAPKKGKELGAQFQVSGEIISIVKRTTSTKDIYYKFTMNLVDLESGVIKWAGEKEITKTANRRAFGH